MAHTNFCLLESKIVMQMELVGDVPVKMLHLANSYDRGVRPHACIRSLLMQYAASDSFCMKY